jgi:O-antigen/teichoic acid export membrane protein
MGLSGRQLIRNSVWTFLEITLYPLLMIVATPVFIAKLGIDQYGLWMLINTIALGINFFNVGVGDTNIRLISRHRAENNSDAIRTVFRFNFSLSVFLCLVALITGAIFWKSGFLGVFCANPPLEDAGFILFIACASTGIKFIETSLVSVFKAYERFDLSSRLSMISKNSVAIVNLTLALTGFTLHQIFVSIIVCNVLNIIVQMFVLSRFNPQLVLLPALNFYKQWREYVSINFLFWLQGTIALAGFLADKLAVAYFTDVKTMGYYSIASLIGSQIHNFFMAFGSFFFPRVSFNSAANKELSPLYYSARSFVALPGWLLITFLLVGGDFIFRMWLGNETYLQSILFIKLYLVFEAGMLLIIVPFYFINGSAILRLNSVFEILIRSSHLVALLAGYYINGVTGILYGLIISTLVNLPVQYYFFHRRVLTGVSPTAFLWVTLPVVMMLGLAVTGNGFYQLALIVCLIISAKIIYFNPARYNGKYSLFSGHIFRKVEG